MVPPRPAGFQAGIRVAGRLWGMTEAITLLILAVQTGLIELQEFVEALPCSFSLSLPADLSSVHGLYDLPVLPHGLLASHHHLLLNPHLSPGCGVRGVLWCIRDCIWRVECDGKHHHLGPLVL
ncbi:uncharacterized protein LOC109198359 isoform X2 [Oreochromis niloticus]|uniref:uncharacterized protein LOC109198359 isoform X2 n=1 Tax=Oreochromis niloticus TaxID=8128 RepID=UPI00090566A3|nr:uncharacterized protein LOC109198359 isoform X2 [Oreochromis niloticus]